MPGLYWGWNPDYPQALHLIGISPNGRRALSGCGLTGRWFSDPPVRALCARCLDWLTQQEEP